MADKRLCFDWGHANLQDRTLAIFQFFTRYCQKERIKIIPIGYFVLNEALSVLAK